MPEITTPTELFTHKLGAALTTSARLGTVVGTCATDTSTSNDATCLDTFIRRFGARALRRIAPG